MTLDLANKARKWTKEQKRAIEEDGCNLLVSAAAGAGKTAVLVERIVRKITNPEAPVDIDRLLVVTFTNAAAAEMRERIGKALGSMLDESQNIQRQLLLLGKANITTIHSFCLDVIKNNFHTIDLDPSFRIADDTEALLLQMEALEELIESKYGQENCSEEFLSLVECYGGKKDDNRLADLVLTVYEFVRSHPWPEVWLKDAAEAFNASGKMDFGDTKWAQVLMKSISIEVSGLQSLLEDAIRTAERAEGLSPYVSVLREDKLKINEILKACSGECGWDALYEAFRDLDFSRLSRCGKEADVKAREKVKAARDDVKERLNKLKKDIVSGSSKDLNSDLIQLYPVMNSLACLVTEFMSNYRAKKKKKGVIDFNDLEHYCLKILTIRENGKISSTPAAHGLREHFEEIYIDEYQDSNLTQEVILKTVSREDEGKPNMFMVGDVKQSIYRFRQAKPELFIQKLKTYSGDLESKYRKILLNKNFRSRESIINGVNYIFSLIMSENLGDINYTKDERLYAGAIFESSEEIECGINDAVELHIIDSKKTISQETEDNVEGFDDSDEADLPDSIQCEARVAAKRIKELVSDSGPGYLVYERETKKYRPARYKDIVILLRTAKNWADVFEEELSLNGIPVFADTGTGYFRTVEISTVLSLLQIIDNPLQDIPLLAVLRSPVGGFFAEELIDIRLFNREAAFYDAMVCAAATDGQLGRKAAGFLKKLEQWRKKAVYLSTDELIWYLYNDTGYYSFVGAMPGGANRRANLRMLFDKARQYEESSFKGLFNFIGFINKLVDSKGDMGSAKILGEKDDVVRIMSIHKSKGLEFPIVFVCGTGKGFNLTDTAKSILFHHDLGIGPDFIDYKRRIWYPSIIKQALKHKIRLESLSEEMRILYVAFTRAKEKLIITGSVNDRNKSAIKWKNTGISESENMSEFDVLNGKSFMDWICTALMRHPSGQLAKKLGVNDSDIFEAKDNTGWDIRLWEREDVLRKTEIEGQSEDELADEAAPASAESVPNGRDEILLRLDWKYPYSAFEKLPEKVTVTELSRYFVKSASGMVKKPGFLEGEVEMTAAEKGSLIHFVLRHIDFKGEVTKAGIRKQIEAMVASELLTEVQALNVDIRKIVNLMNSELGGRMIKAPELFREIPFTMEAECAEVFKNIPGCEHKGETVVLQGVIDCYFEEEEKLVLVDYKSDYINQGETDKIKEKYKTQSDYYAKALEHITGKEIAGKYIYSFWIDSAIEC